MSLRDKIVFLRKIIKSGRSSVIAIPPVIMENLRWEVGDEVRIWVDKHEFDDEHDVIILKIMNPQKTPIIK